MRQIASSCICEAETSETDRFIVLPARKPEEHYAKLSNHKITGRPQDWWRLQRRQQRTDVVSCSRMPPRFICRPNAFLPPHPRCPAKRRKPPPTTTTLKSSGRIELQKYSCAVLSLPQRTRAREQTCSRFVIDVGDLEKDAKADTGTEKYGLRSIWNAICPSENRVIDRESS
jgi:hypothetical protein